MRHRGVYQSASSCCGALFSFLEYFSSLNRRKYDKLIIQMGAKFQIVDDTCLELGDVKKHVESSLI
jgi:hypothetical protein